MALSDAIYYEGEQSDCGTYTSGVKVNNSWFLTSDTKILRQLKLKGYQRSLLPQLVER